MDALIPPLNAPNIGLRSAQLSDAHMLLAWRNDPITRQESVNSDLVTLEQHLSWLKKVLSDPARALFVAEFNNEAVGTVRLDYAPDYLTAELSWTVAPGCRGRGIGKHMVKYAVQQNPTLQLIARVKLTNVASQKIAEFAGFKPAYDADSMRWYKRSPIAGA